LTFGLTFLDQNKVFECFVEDFMYEIPDENTEKVIILFNVKNNILWKDKK